MLHKNNPVITLNKDHKDAHIALVVSLYNRELTESLEKKCVETLVKNGIARNHIAVAQVPGAFEIPLACQKLAQSKQYSAIIALGAIIKGDTYHFELVANECARGVMDVMLKYDIPIIFEVLAGAREDMIKRCKDDEYNKGLEAADAAMRVL
jgi:6,7-dimethyl-8-ribityllumazine synthase